MGVWAGSATCQLSAPRSGHQLPRSDPTDSEVELEFTWGWLPPVLDAFTCQDASGDVVTVVVPHWRFSSTDAAPSKVPSRVMLPVDVLPLPQPSRGPAANKLPTTSPRQTATTSPPTNEAGVRRSTIPKPRPTRISGHSRQASASVELETVPWLYPSGMAPSTIRKTPQFNRPRLTLIRNHLSQAPISSGRRCNGGPVGPVR